MIASHFPRAPHGVRFLRCGSRWGCDDPFPFKHFGARADAVAYGQSRVQSGAAEQAVIYAVADISDARPAIAALQAGKAAYVQSCSRHASETEIEAANEQAWKSS